MDRINTCKKISVDIHAENEIQFIKRTSKNYLHKVIEDEKIVRITSWKISTIKFYRTLFFNIITFGILHIFSLYYPKLYIKLYCNPCNTPKECDYFLVEDIYRIFTLCKKIQKKNTQNNNYFSNSSNSYINLNTKTEYSYLYKHLTYSFEYKSVIYEYDEEKNKIFPVYMDLSKLSNKAIYNFFIDGLSSEILVNKFRARYGLNEYKIDQKIFLIHSTYIQPPILLGIIVTTLIEYFLRDTANFILSLILIFLAGIAEIIVKIDLIYSKYDKKYYSLDGEKYKIKVRRNYLIKNKNLEYAEINNIDLLPGDIIYLSENDIAPCDCILMEGECIVNESNINGSLDIFKKYSLNINSNNFDYNLNKINIILHGMKILKIFSKIHINYIAALCINTGSNTTIANQYSNILYLFERKKVYKEIYELLGDGRKIFLIRTIIRGLCQHLVFIITIIFTNRLEGVKKNPLRFTGPFLRMLCKNYMPLYYLILHYLSYALVLRLKYENIHCFDNSRLFHAGKINNVVLGKTDTLSTNKFEIIGYHPVIINHLKNNSIFMGNFCYNEGHEMNLKLIDYYKEYLNASRHSSNKKINNIVDIKKKKLKKVSKEKLIMKCKDSKNQKINENNEYIALFLECLLSCNNIEQFNTELSGNLIETTIFQSLKWEINSLDNSNQEIYLNFEDNNKNNKKENTNYKFSYDNDGYFVDKRISDIFPKNYFKITGIFNKKSNSNYQSENNFFNSIVSQNDIDKKYLNNSSSNPTSFLDDTISQNNITTYKLRIYKRFILNGTLNSSAIVFNFLTKKLRFMTKGNPEEIIPKCLVETLPNNLEDEIIKYRKNGYIVIVCATKILEKNEDYDDNNTYMKNLVFCGIFTLKYKLKQNVKQSISDFKNYKTKIVVSTGDNLYNTLAVNYECGLIGDKRIFSFDLDPKTDKIIISNINNFVLKKKLISRDSQMELLKNGKNNSYIFNKNTMTPSLNPKKFLIKRTTSINTKISESLLSKTSHVINNNDLSKIQLNKNTSINQKSIDEINLNNTNNKEDSPELVETRSHTNVKSHKKNDLKKIERRDGIKYPTVIMNNKLNNIENNNHYPYDLMDKYFSRNNTNVSENNVQINKTNSFIEEEREENANLFIKQNNKVIYSPEILKKLRRNSIFCISGKAFNLIYMKKNEYFYNKLLTHIDKLCKIYYRMSSLDKSKLIDYFRDFKENTVCVVGATLSDIDSIMTAQVGISLKQPKNLNTILCHFYFKNSDISQIKKVLINSRIFDENTFSLFYNSLVFNIVINSYIMACYFSNASTIKGQLNILTFSFIILSMTGFSNQEEESIKCNAMIQSQKYFRLFSIVLLCGLILIKFLTMQSMMLIYQRNSELDTKTVSKIFCTYFFLLNFSQLISASLSMNINNFYRKHFLSNNYYVFAMFLAILYLISAFCLNGGSHYFDIFKVLNFEQLDDNIDCFDDKNKLHTFYLSLADILISIGYCKLIYVILLKLAEKNKKNS